MSAETQPPGWQHFARELADSVGVPVGEITPEARLVAELGLDSLALTELIVLLIEKYAPVGLMQGLEEREWERVTVEELYKECIGDNRGRWPGTGGLRANSPSPDV